MAGMVTPERRKDAVKALELIQYQALHAGKLSFVHPITNEPIEFKAPLPDDFHSVLDLFEISEYKKRSKVEEMDDVD